MKNKVIYLYELAKILNDLKGDGKRIVQCHGAFDLLHIGHIRHLEAAKEFGDVLVVTVTPDKYIDKGPYRPAFNEELRMEALAALSCVDYVAINEWPTASEAINLLQPNVFAKGIEYNDPDNDRARGFMAEEKIVHEVGGEIIFTDEITSSSSNLINRYLNTFSKEAKDFLARFACQYSVDTIINYLESVNTQKVLVIGEAIIDEYRFGLTMGRARKEPILVFNTERTEKYAGGALVVANHVSSFCQKVDLIAMIGDHKTQENFIRSGLNKNVTARFYSKKDSPTVVKTRFLDIEDNRKLFEAYDLKDTSLDEGRSNLLSSYLRKVLGDYDLIITCDAGHGLFTTPVLEALENAKYLAINAQLNPGNFGFNTINKYQHPAYVCVNEGELRLATGYKYEDVEDIIKKRFEETSIDKVIVTRGWRGCTIYSKGELLNIPAFTDRVVDKIGAGDALLSVTAPLASIDAPIDIIGFIGNVTGAIAVSYPGNKEVIQKEELYKYIKALMK